MNMKSILWIAMVFAIVACGGNKTPKESDDKAQQVVKEAIVKHGGIRFLKSIVRFEFKGDQYKITRRSSAYAYERTSGADPTMRDVLTDTRFRRARFQDAVEMSAQDSLAAAKSLLSVVQFAQFPYFLNDWQAIKQYLGETTIKSEPYHKVKVTFSDGLNVGDTYVFWFHRNNQTLDYLAFDFEVDGSGARFRAATNPREVEGIRFADYVNYKPKTKKFKVEELDELFNKGELERGTTVELQNIQVDLIAN
jgi:hypothetical protein